MRVAFVALLSVLACARASATKIDPMVWQQMVEDASFVGVVECDRAGGIVAGYVVVESWKGARKPGDSITIRRGVSPHGDLYPLALVGERYVVAAMEGNVSTRLLSTSSFGQHMPPEWMRALPADYGLPLRQGAVQIDAKTGEPMPGRYHSGFDELGSKRDDLASFKRDVTTHLALDDDGRALAVLRALATKYGMPIAKEGTPYRGVLEKIITDYPTAEAPWDFEQVMDQVPRRTKDLAREIAKARGSSGTRTYPRGDGVEQRSLFGDDVEGATASAPPRAKPTRTEAIAALADERDQRFHESLAFLLEEEPAAAVAWLAERPPTFFHERPLDTGRELGSWVCATVSQNNKLTRDTRVQLLEKLATSAKDRWAGISGAIYLAFDDDARAFPHLRRFASTPGDAGTWAALALARRGDRAMLERAVDVLAPVDDKKVGNAHWILRIRVIELLSNTAKSANVAPLVSSADLYGAWNEKPAVMRRRNEKLQKKVRAFLDAHPDAKPNDPWMQALIKKRVD